MKQLDLASLLQGSLNFLYFAQFFPLGESQRKLAVESEVFQQSGLSPSAPHQQLRWSTLQRTPPPRGFEEFFAKLANDPLVQVWKCAKKMS